MKQNQQPSHQSVRLFKNSALEALTHVHPAVPFVIWVPVVLYCLYLAHAMAFAITTIIGLFLVGVLFWTLTEYAMHRFVFHFKAESKIGKYMVFLFHGIHHDDPQDPTRLVMPPVVSIALGSFFYFIFEAVIGPSHYAFFSGFIAGYLVYDFLHFAIHHFKPKTAWGRNLKEYHMKHHFIEHGAKWGVSSSLWDRVFRTYT